MTSKSGYVGSLSPEYALLGFLARQPDHGYELHQRLSAELGQVWHISQSQVYSILKRLETRGDITGAVQEQEKLPSRLLYRLTPAGRARFEAWLETPTGSSIRAIRVEFITRLYFASQVGPEAANALIDSQVEETRKGLARLQKMFADLPSEQAFNRLGLELRIKQLSSILDWLEECRAVVNRPVGFHRGGQA
ncbi:MAG TPA: PadR family transcriptional regulator [Anaerolineales bacterium]